MPPPSNTRSARSSSNSPSGRRKGKTWFLGIGINRYQYFPPLNNAVKDVEDIKNLLLEKYELDAEQVRLLLDEAATRDNIFDELDRLIEEITEEDKLILYYSGHGHLSAVNGFWIPCEAQKNRTSHYINNSSIRDYVKAIKARHILLISDSCFSGSLFVRGVGRSGEVGLEDMESIPSRWALCSGRHDEEVYDGEPGKNSPFAESILDALRDNQYQSFNVAKLAVRVVEQTRSNYRQLPEGSPLQGVGHKGGQFVFWLKRREADDWAACQNEGTLAAYQGFLLKYPDSRFREEARQNIAFLEEEDAWRAARSAHTLTAYYRSDRQYPQGRYTQQSLEIIAELEEEAAWKKARLRHTFSSYRKYTLDYPQGRYRKEAEEQIEEIAAGQQEPNFWRQTTEKDTSVAYEDYLKRYPQGQYRVEAKNRLTELQEIQAEREAWRQAQEKGGEQDYQVFLKQYPQSSFAAEARNALERIKAENARRQQAQKEAADWAVVEKSSSLQNLKNYLKNYPQGKHAVEARQRLSALEGDKPPRLQKHIRWAAPLLLLLILAVWGAPKLLSSGQEELSANPSKDLDLKTIVLNKQTWLAENLNLYVDDSWCYEGKGENCKKYGRLYTWDAAKKGCAALGSGWRLPTDREWREMAKQFGGVDDDASDSGAAAYEALMNGGSSGFAALFGGWRSTVGSYYHQGVYGYYWSGSSSDESNAWYYRFYGDSKRLYRNYNHKGVGRSVRCLQD